MKAMRRDVVGVGLIAAVTCAYVVIFHYRAPYFDEWDLVALFRAADAGELTLARLFEVHGGHWHAGAYALLVPLAHLTRWSHVAESVVSLAFAAGACALALRLAFNFAHAAAPNTRFGPYALTTAFLVLSLDQASNLLWGFQLSVFIGQFGVYLALAALTERRLGLAHFVVALLGVGLGVASYATAFAAVPLGLALILLRTDASMLRRAVFAIVWTALLGVVCAAFVVLQRGEPHGGGLDLADLSHADFLGFLVVFELIYLGAGLTRFASDLVVPVALTGLGLAAVAAFMLARRGVLLQALAIPLGLCAYGIGAGLLMGLGRYDFTADQGGNARYISFSTAYWLGAALLVLAALSHAENKAVRRTLIAAFALLAVLKTGNCIQSAVKHARISHDVAAAAEAMRTDPLAGAEAARRLAMARQDVDAHLAFMRERRWSVFR